jgi:DNA-binding beta-propeller fold protein YncE
MATIGSSRGIENELEDISMKTHPAPASSCGLDFTPLGVFTPQPIAVDRSGNVFVTGGSSSGGTTVAYSNTGVPLWMNRVVNVSLSKMAVDRSGNVFVTGSSYDELQLCDDQIFIKHSAAAP